MQTVLIIIGLILVFLVVINYLRKLHLDALHFNLLELADDIEGRIIRRGFLSRPVYHGRYKNVDLTINFSSERAQKKRRQYLDISLATELKNNLTISTRNWIENRNEASTADFKTLEINGEEEYVIKHALDADFLKKNQSEKFSGKVQALIPFAYIFCGQNGIMFERECENLAVCTKKPRLRETVEALYQLSQILK